MTAAVQTLLQHFDLLSQVEKLAAAEEVLRRTAGPANGQPNPSSAVTDRRQEALVVRRLWLREMGLSEEEIEADIQNEELDLQEELEQLDAARRLKTKTPPYQVLSAWAKKP